MKQKAILIKVIKETKSAEDKKKKLISILSKLPKEGKVSLLDKILRDIPRIL